ncbi:MAG TPA: bifunctional diguanylate cyclase/phosphodiesterase [Acidothermaceae bacterium]
MRTITARVADAPSGPAVPWRAAAFARLTAAARAIRFAPTPAIATPRAMAKTAGLLYICASTMSLVALGLHQLPQVHRGPLVVIAAGSLAIGITVVLVGQLWPPWCYHLLILNANIAIAVGMYEGGGGRTSLAYATLYTFVAINCFFFFAWPSACLHLAVAIGISVFTLSILGEADFGQVLLLPGTLIVVAVVVGRLVRAADAAELDTLTGLPNRRGLDRHMSEAVADAALGTHTVALAFLDVDHFRSVNHSEGQSGGDRLLRSIAAAWRPLLRDGDFLARNGSDEFALLLIDAQPGDVTNVTGRLRAAMPRAHTCSAGVADWQPGDTVSLLAARADTALYESKRGGRNRVTYHDSTHNTEDAVMRKAVAEGEVIAYYQPIIELGSGLVTGFEALARWIRPGHGMVAPDAFIPQAEQSGAIEDIGAMMLRDACGQVAIWSKAHGRPLVASVNVCGRELRNPTYVRRVRAILADAELPASQLVLELTETAFEGDADPVVEALAELHALGIRIAIDDFGTGYSSLSRLDQLPVDVVKIDRSFVSPLPPEAIGAPLVAAIAAMAHALGLQVVAEGIEHPSQAALLFSLGCDKGQGFWFARPCPADQVDLSRREPARSLPGTADAAATVRKVG